MGRGVVAALALVVAAAGCQPPAPPVAAPTRATLRDGVILVSAIGGGAAGREDRLEVSEDGVARLWVQGRLQAATRLGGEERRRLDELVATHAAVSDGDASESAATDGIRSRLAFAGRGRGEDRSAIEGLAASLGRRLMAHAEVWSAEVLVVGRPTGVTSGSMGPARNVLLQIDQVLTASPTSELGPGSFVQIDQAFLPAGRWTEQPRAFRIDTSLARRPDGSWSAKWARGVAMPPDEVPLVLAEQRALGL
jgi:hypothetical protein